MRRLTSFMRRVGFFSSTPTVDLVTVVNKIIALAQTHGVGIEVQLGEWGGQPKLLVPDLNCIAAGVEHGTITPAKLAAVWEKIPAPKKLKTNDRDEELKTAARRTPKNDDSARDEELKTVARRTPESDDDALTVTPLTLLIYNTAHENTVSVAISLVTLQVQPCMGGEIDPACAHVAIGIAQCIGGGVDVDQRLVTAAAGYKSQDENNNTTATGSAMK